MISGQITFIKSLRPLPLLFWIIILLMPEHLQAQSTAVAPAPPRIQIESIVYSEANDLYVVNLSYINALDVSNLNVKIVNSETTVLTDEFFFIRNNAVQFSAEKLEPETQYIVEITALDIANNPVQYTVESFNQTELVTVETEREFLYSPPNRAPVFVIDSVVLNSESLGYDLAFQLANTEDTARYEIRVEDSSTRHTVRIFNLNSPLDLPLFISMEGLPTSEYAFYAKALADDGTILANTEFEGVKYEKPRTNPFSSANSPYIIGVVVVGILILVTYLVRSTFTTNSPYNATLGPYEIEPPPPHGKKPVIPPATLDILPAHVCRSSQVYITNTPFLIGSGASNDLVLRHNMISSRHAEISFDQRRFWICDRGSTNGTLLNGRRLPPGRLVPVPSGSEIRLGNAAQLRFNVR